MRSFFLELVTLTDEARRNFEKNPAVLSAVASGMTIERYRNLLLELYHIVWHFNPVCAAGASRIPDIHRQIRYFLYEHMHEESGHEEWVINDLEALGITKDQVSAHQPSAFTLSLIGYNYWAADRRQPASVLGMIYTLEVIASVYGGPFSLAIKEALHLEAESGISFIGSHAKMDAEHMAELRLMLNTLDDVEAQKAIAESAIVNFHHFTRIFEAI
jgi:pyrroloquinoline quinone (PQQ) biosynthesis protein C